jgi:hypothetical protein
MTPGEGRADFAIREFSKYRRHLLFAQRRQLDDARWEPVADWLLRRARMFEIFAVVLALMLLGMIHLAAATRESPFLGFIFYGGLLVSCVREATSLRTTVRIVRDEAGEEVVPPPRPGLASR